MPSFMDLRCRAYQMMVWNTIKSFTKPENHSNAISDPGQCIIIEEIVSFIYCPCLIFPRNVPIILFLWIVSDSIKKRDWRALIGVLWKIERGFYQVFYVTNFSTKTPFYSLICNLLAQFLLFIFFYNLFEYNYFTEFSRTKTFLRLKVISFLLKLSCKIFFESLILIKQTI
jgi:hypothetical protein